MILRECDNIYIYIYIFREEDVKVKVKCISGIMYGMNTNEHKLYFNWSQPEVLLTHVVNILILNKSICFRFHYLLTYFIAAITFTPIIFINENIFGSQRCALPLNL